MSHTHSHTHTHTHTYTHTHIHTHCRAKDVAHFNLCLQSKVKCLTHTHSHTHTYTHTHIHTHCRAKGRGPFQPAPKATSEEGPRWQQLQSSAPTQGLHQHKGWRQQQKRSGGLGRPEKPLDVEEGQHQQQQQQQQLHVAGEVGPSSKHWKSPHVHSQHGGAHFGERGSGSSSSSSNSKRPEGLGGEQGMPQEASLALALSQRSPLAQVRLSCDAVTLPSCSVCAQKCRNVHLAMSQQSLHAHVRPTCKTTASLRSCTYYMYRLDCKSTGFA